MNNNSTVIPEKGSWWRHSNGTPYKVLVVANEDTESPDDYPVTVVYENRENGKVWCRPLSDWYRSMTVDPGA